MLDKFREIYEDERMGINMSSLGQAIFDLTEVRAFVYEVCKRCVEEEASQQENPADCLFCKDSTPERDIRFYCSFCGRKLKDR